MKAVILTHREWDKIFTQIKRDYADSPATYMIRGRMKDVLGFTHREHFYDNNIFKEPDTGDWRDYHSQIHIDFYSEQARTMFVLRYMNRD